MNNNPFFFRFSLRESPFRFSVQNMDKLPKDDLTAEEIANANTVILVDPDGTQPLDSALGEYADDSACTKKENRSSDKESDSQSTYISNYSVGNDDRSFSLSDISSDSKSSMNNMRLGQPRETSDSGYLPVTSVEAVASPGLSPMVNKHLSGVLPHLSSTPIFSGGCNSSEEIKKESGSTGITSRIKISETESKSTQTPRRRRRKRQSSDKSNERLHSIKRFKDKGDVPGMYKAEILRKRKCDQQNYNDSDDLMPSTKHFKVADDNEVLSCKDNKVEYETHEHMFTLVGFVSLLIDKKTDKICSAHLKQVSIADNLEDSGSGVAIVPTGWQVRNRLSVGSSANSSGNLADRSATASTVSSTASIPVPFELPVPHSKSLSKGGSGSGSSGSGNHRDSLTSTASSLTSVCRSNGVRYLDYWYSKHHLTDQCRNSVLKLCLNQRVQLFCPECNYKIPTLADSPFCLADSPVQSTCTHELVAGNNNEEKTVPSINKDTNVGERTVTERHEADVESINLRNRENSLNTHESLFTDCSEGRYIFGQSEQDIVSQVPKLAEVKLILMDKKDQASVFPTSVSASNEVTQVKNCVFNPQPSTSRGDCENEMVVHALGKSTSSSYSTSDSDVFMSVITFNSPFIDKEEIVPLPDDVKGKTGPKHRSKGINEVENSTIIMENGLQIPYPDSQSKLFEKCNFLFTYSRVSWQKQRIKDEVISKSSSGSELEDASSTFSEEFVACTVDPSRLTKIITLGGGRVYQSLTEVPFNEWSSTYLIANCPSRTVLYLQCLAVGIARFSQINIFQSCIKKIKFKDVLSSSVQLPTGWSEELQRTVSEQRNHQPLEGFKVLLALDKKLHNSSEITFWETLLTSMAASVTVCENSQSMLKLNSINIMVTDKNCSCKLVEEAGRTGIPTVNCNWIIHTLIHGEYRFPDASPVYKHTYIPEHKNY
ncbi:uncharacterized protein LOC142327348 [Lycorma delicatula]|uniref:uncharacterized protein LOC142327348 n=1 Tax=Lycorma delicatula TaxID=130591 RepID=UPI003F5184FD